MSSLDSAARLPVYDPDCGLLDAIEALTAPPTFCNGKTKKAPRWKPPTRWKSANSQYCNACREGGELLCCDRCPASFHLMCHEPPIDRSRIPSGKWLCNRCAYAIANNEVSLKGTKKNLKSLTEEGGALSTEAGRNEAAITGVIERMETGQDPLAVLADAALAINAQQFGLPEEITKDVVPLPHDESRPPHAALTPGVLCNVCSKGAEDALLIQCSFCSLRYHLNCIDPPLTVPPKDKWMCPAHPEHFVDRRMLTSLSLTERLRLWKKYARQPMEEHVVKLTFLQKAHSENPCVPLLLQSGIELRRKRHQIPRSVKELYRKRWKYWAKDELPSGEEQDAWFDALLRMQRMDAALMLNGGAPPQPKDEPLDEVKKEDASSVNEESYDPEEGPSHQNNDRCAPNRLAMSRAGALIDKDLAEIGRLLNDPKGLCREELISRVRYECLRCMERKSASREGRLVGALAFQRLQQIVTANSAPRASKPLSFDQRSLRKGVPVLGVLKADGAEPFAVQQLKTTIGASPDCDVDLCRICPICIALAAHHADLVFDRTCRRFELIPKGGEAVWVDGVCYSLGESVTARGICSCTFYTQCDATARQQGGARLRHGSIIRIGCTRFVFASFF